MVYRLLSGGGGGEKGGGTPLVRPVDRVYRVYFSAS